MSLPWACDAQSLGPPSLYTAAFCTTRAGQTDLPILCGAICAPPTTSAFYLRAGREWSSYPTSGIPRPTSHLIATNGPCGFHAHQHHPKTERLYDSLLSLQEQWLPPSVSSLTDEETGLREGCDLLKATQPASCRGSENPGPVYQAGALLAVPSASRLSPTCHWSLHSQLRS